MEILLGAGHSRDKRVSFDGIPKAFSGELVTVDFDESTNPTIVHNLNHLPYPFDDNVADEIHCYEILEHLGTQGDFRFFFDQFSELHRILKPDAYLMGSCPNWDSHWAWSDPGHTRMISPWALKFLDQDCYDECGEKGSARSDYRFCYEADFKIIGIQEEEHNFYFILQAKK